MSSRFRSSDTAPAASQDGFTLLEVLIAMAVLVFISMGIYQATTETYRLREILSNEGDFYNGIRLSMDILQRDISLLYSPIIMTPPKKEDAPPGVPPSPANAQDMQAIMSSDLGQTSQFWLPAQDRSAIRPSRFVGTDNKLTFVAASHLRIYKDAPESYFAKITYEIRKDDSDRNNDTMVLIKTENVSAFENDETRDKSLVRSFPLLHGITKLRYRFYRKDKDQWYTSWDSEKEDFKDTYPDMVELTLTVNGLSRMSFEGIYIFRPEIPLRGLDPST